MTGPDEHLEERLRERRPLPSPGFQTRLRAMLKSSKDWPAPRAESRRRAPAYRPVAFGYATAGAACLLVALLGVAGAGPFAS